MAQKGVGVSHNSKSVRRVSARQREEQAVVLRSSGASYDNIAESLGYKQRDAAYKAVQRGIRRMGEQNPESIEMARTMSLRRLDDMTFALMPAARQGDLASIDRVLRLEMRRADLLGLDAPKTFEARIQMDINAYNTALKDFVEIFRHHFADHEDAPKVIDAIDKVGEQRFGEVI